MAGVGQRHTFNRNTSAPSNYVAGLGRGAIGFTTRSDIGPARNTSGKPEADNKQAPAGYVVKGAKTEGKFGKEKGGRNEKDFSETNFNEFDGYGHSLFNDSIRDKDDVEADRVYRAVDERMDSKRRRRREELEKERLSKYRNVRPRIADQFADLKAQLKGVSENEWNEIPEVGEYSLRYKAKPKADKFTPVPDSVIDDARSSQNDRAHTSVSHRQQKYGGFQTPMGGFQTPLGGFQTPLAGFQTPIGGFRTPMSGGFITPGWRTPGTASSLTGLSQAREQVLSLRLDKMSDSVTGQTVVDPKGYLTDLNSMKMANSADIGDIKKGRMLLESVIKTNPKHGPGWIAAARFEEAAGKMVQARKLIKQGCEASPESEDVWLEAARLATPANAKIIFANAVRHIPKSVKIWMAATKLENEVIKKKAVLRRALEFIPNSVRLWKAAVELENPKEARIMLTRAVECVPLSVDLWLALAQLETYQNARMVLNKAREKVPTNPRIWVTAAKLEEANGNTQSLLDKIIENAIKSLSAQQVVIDRDQWLKEAEASERAGAPGTAAAIVKASIDMGIEPEDRKRTYMDDAENALSRGATEVARAVYDHSLKKFPGKQSIWMKAIQLEKSHASSESVENMLRRAVKHVPEEKILWLMAAKHKWREMGDVPGARRILNEAFAANPDSEKIWLAAVKLESENGEVERARSLLAKARERAPTKNVWLKSAIIEWEAGNLAVEEKILEAALNRYPRFDKLWMMYAQLAEEREDLKKARKRYHQAVTKCPQSLTLWTLAAKNELKATNIMKARSLLEIARMKNPKSPPLYIAAVKMELQAGNKSLAEQLMSKALQECPTNGDLWVEEIKMMPRKRQNSRSVDALKRCDNNGAVVLIVARIFARDRKYQKARKWFNRSVTLKPDFGDAWAAYYKAELEAGEDDGERAEEVLKRCEKMEPNRGALWCSISKAREHRRKSTAEILKIVASKIDINTLK